MISKAQKKHIRSLQQKKFRKELGEFIVEGNKSIKDFIKNNYEPVNIYTTTPDVFHQSNHIVEISAKELKSISLLKNPKDSLAVFKIKRMGNPDLSRPILILDFIQDPGNLGTIIRTANWFGWKQIICSLDTVDVYSPKVIQAGMGALASIQIFYKDLPDFLKKYPEKIYGTFMHGKPVYKENFPENFALIIGNEGNGIRETTQKFIQQKITIPKHPESTAESLNAGVATGIILSEVWKYFNVLRQKS